MTVSKISRTCRTLAAKAAFCLLVSATLTAQESSVGPPADGVHYTVASSSEVTKADATDCGYNDPGIPNMGIFRRERRDYEEFKEGKSVRRWQDTVDVFVRCHEV